MSFNQNPRGSIFVLAVLGAGAMTLGCAPILPPASTTGPSASREGVALALVGQSCSENLDPDFEGVNLVEEVLRLRIANPTAGALTVHRDRLELRAPGGATLEPVSWRSADPMAIAPGQDLTFDVRYMARGTLACAAKTTLAAPNAVITGEGEAVELSPIVFQARSRAL